MVIRIVHIVILFIFLSIKSNGQNRDYTYLCYSYDTVSNTFGYINIKGNFVIKPQYLLAYNFSDNHAFVQFKDSTWGLINYKGEKVYSLPDSIGNNLVENIIKRAKINKNVPYIDIRLYNAMEFYLNEIELNDSVLILSNEWFSDKFNNYLLKINPNIIHTEFYYHIKKGILMNKNNTPITSYRLLNFSEGFALTSQNEIIDNAGTTISIIPDSLFVPDGTVCSNRFLNGKLLLCNYAKYNEKNKRGETISIISGSKLGYAHIIFNTGKIHTITDTIRLNQIFDSISKIHFHLIGQEKAVKIKNVNYSCHEARVPSTKYDDFFYDNYTYYSAKNKEILFPFWANTYSDDNSKPFKYDDTNSQLIGFWNYKHKIKITPRPHRLIGNQFIKVSTK